MRYVTSIERRAIQKGIEQGVEQGSLQTAREDILDILHIRFSTVPQELIEQIDRMTDLSQLKSLLRQAVRTPTLEDFERFIDGGKS